MNRLLIFFLPVVAFPQSHADFRAALIEHEGYSLAPYKDTLGYYTIGIGHKMLANEPVTPWSPERVEAVFTVDLARAYHAALVEVPNYPDHSPAVRIVIVEMAFQCGQKGLRDFKRFRAALARMDYLAAVEELTNSKLARQTPGRVKSHQKVLTEAAKGVE